MENSTDVRPRVKPAPVRTVEDAEVRQAVVDIGVWVSGIESFLSAPPNAGRGADPAADLRLVNWAVRRCLLLNAVVWGEELPRGVSRDAVREVGTVLRELLLIGPAGEEASAGQGQAWSRLVRERISTLRSFDSIVRFAEIEGEHYLPEPLLHFIDYGAFDGPDGAELALILPRFGKVLRWLDVIGRMLEADEPLKPALLIFARVFEQIAELTDYINTRLEKFADNEADLFASLDAASYTASMELKKVTTLELAGLGSVRPTPSVYARMETSYALLNDGFRQIVANLGRAVDPEMDVFKLFPAFNEKRESSLRLRQELHELTSAVQKAESEPADDTVTSLRAKLVAFHPSTSRHLFYKDTETVERFIEEIAITKENSDLVPILHRFGAYLDTLFGQVCLRAVLAERPFVTN
jgi:hypothetical protein